MKKRFKFSIFAMPALLTALLFLGLSFRNVDAGPNDPILPVNFVEGKVFRFMGGDPVRGQSTFVKLNCNQCHRIEGIDDLPEPKGKRRLNLTLAKEIRFVKRYEDIITAITTPRHVINKQYKGILSEAELAGDLEPFMPDLSEFMSARQLIDLVTFLDSIYDDKQPTYLAGDKNK